MGTSSDTNFNHQPPPKMLPPRQHPRPGLQASLSIASSDAAEPLSNSDQGHDSPPDSTSSREPWPIEANHSNSIPVKKSDKEKEGESEYPEPPVIHRVSTMDKLSLHEIARDRVDVIADRIMVMPTELSEELKSELRVILEGGGGSQNRDGFLNLQHLVHGRSDLTPISKSRLQHKRDHFYHPKQMATAADHVKEVLPPRLDATAEPPSLFDGTTRLYISYTCPYAQRTWIARNAKGLQEKIKLVPIDLQNRPAWYKEKVYSGNKVPALEHNNQVKGESLDLIKYIDENFEGPKLLPDDTEKQQIAEELFTYSDDFNRVNYHALISKGDVPDEVGAAYDKLEEALGKFNDGPFLLGQFSLVDIAYAPFIERFQPLFQEVKNYDITTGRPGLTKWIEELNKIDAYTATRRDPQEILVPLKKKFGIE